MALTKNQPEIINLVDTDDDELYKDLEAQKAALKWDDSSNAIEIKTEGGGGDSVIPQHRAQDSGNKSDSSKPHLQNLYRHDYDAGISFVHIASSSRPRPRRMIVEEESDEEADPYNPWTPPIYTGHELDFDTPALDAPAAEIPVIDSPIISEPVDSNNNKGKGPKMTCIYSQLQFDEDELERERNPAPAALFDQDENDFGHGYEEPSLREMCRKRKRNSPATYSKITEEASQRLIEYWTVHMCTVAEAARAVHMHPRTAWR